MFDAVSYYIDWVCVLFQPTAVLAVGKCIRWLFVAIEQEVKKKQVLLSRCVWTHQLKSKSVAPEATAEN